MMENNPDCPCLGKTLPRLLRPGIMAVLAKEQTHGYQIAQVLSDLLMFEGRAPDTAGIYRALKEMQDEGLVISHWQTAQAGPAKKLFEITPEGMECLNNWKKTLRDYRTAVDELLILIK
jgi:DNA-binding PadR family transcriptional regulator